jgi:monothiol glutaredoxin
MNNIQQQISDLITNNKVVLFMKGSADAPMCGFSSTVVQILKILNAPFVAVNVLESNEMRQGIKDFTDWPTIPQLYINGEFVGGCDIAREMYESGELKALLEK